jgi:hypothetical protein
LDVWIGGADPNIQKSNFPAPGDEESSLSAPQFPKRRENFLAQMGKKIIIDF